MIMVKKKKYIQLQLNEYLHVMEWILPWDRHVCNFNCMPISAFKRIHCQQWFDCVKEAFVSTREFIESSLVIPPKYISSEKGSCYWLTLYWGPGLASPWTPGLWTPGPVMLLQALLLLNDHSRGREAGSTAWGYCAAHMRGIRPSLALEQGHMSVCLPACLPVCLPSCLPNSQPASQAPESRASLQALSTPSLC